MTVLILICGSGLAAQSNDRVAAKIKQMDSGWIVDSYFSKDLKDFDRIVADDAVLTDGVGKAQTKKEKRASVAHDYTDPSRRLDRDYVFMVEPSSQVVRVFGKTAISTGYVAEDYMWKTQHVKNRVYFTNAYLKRAGKW